MNRYLTQNKTEKEMTQEKETFDTECENCLSAPRWILFKTEMNHFHDQLSAELAMKKYEAKGHKQTYFVRKAKTSG